MDKPWVVVTFRVSEEIRDKLAEVCSRNNRKQSMILRALVQAYLERKITLTTYTEKHDLSLP